MSDLKPCPFCGGDCACTNWGVRPFWYEGKVQQMYFVAFCVGQTGDYGTEDEAIAAWNTRLTPTDSETASTET